MTSSIQKDPIQGLIDYILDIKPYHSKIAEVLVDYTINDLVRVTIEDQNVMDIVMTEDYDSAFACDEGFGILPFGGPDNTIAYLPDLTIDGYITYPNVPKQLPILYIDPFAFAFYTIIGSNPLTGLWTISGNHVAEFHIGQAIHVDENSGGGNGGYTILAVAPAGPNTAIFVNETIPTGASANGMMSTNVGSFFVPGLFSSTIMSASSVTDSFVVDANRVQIFLPGTQFVVSGTTSNDGTYTVLSTSFNIPLNQTTIFVTTAVPANQGILGDASVALADIITPGSNLTIQNSQANNGVWRVTSATHETGESNPPGFEPTANLTEIRVVFVAGFHAFLPVFNVASFTSPFQFDIAGADFIQNYSVGDAFKIENTTQSYNNSQWIISAITPITGGFRVSSTTHVLDPLFTNLTISPVLFPFPYPVVSINPTTNLFFVAGDQTAVFGNGTFFNAVDITNLNPNQGKWLVTAPPIFDAINNVTRVQAQFNQIFAVPLLTYPLLSASNVTNTFVIAGNQVSFFAPEDEFTVTGTGANDGSYVVLFSSFGGVNTTITVDGVVPVNQGALGNVNTEVADGQVLVFTRSNWDLPEICKTASSTSTSSFIGETLEFISGTEFVYNDFLDVEICDLTASIGWGAADGTEFLTIHGGNQILKQFFVAGDQTTRMGASYAILSASTATNTFVVAGNHTNVFFTGILFNVNGTAANNGSYVVVGSTFGGGNTTITVLSVPANQAAAGTIYTTLITVINSTHSIPQPFGNDGTYNVVSVVYNIGPDTTTITVVEPLPSSTIDGTILFQPIVSIPSMARTGWDDCGWDTQSGLTMYQYRLAFAPPTDTFTSYSIDGTAITPHGFSDGDVVNVSGALPLPLPLVFDTNYYVKVVTTTTFKLATSSANLAANIFITATTTGNLEYQFVDNQATWLNYTSGKINMADPGSYLQTYANASFGENLSIAVTFGEDAGTVVGSWDYPYWDIGGYDEDTQTLLSLYGSSF